MQEFCFHASSNICKKYLKTNFSGREKLIYINLSYKLFQLKYLSRLNFVIFLELFTCLFDFITIMWRTNLLFDIHLDVDQKVRVMLSSLGITKNVLWDTKVK